MNSDNYYIFCRYQLLGQTTKQPLSNFEPKNLENISNFQGWGLTLVAYKKRKCNTPYGFKFLECSPLTLSQRTFPQLDSYPTGYFSDQAVLRFYVSLNGQIPQITIPSARHFPKWPFPRPYVSPNKYCAIKSIYLSDQ